MIRLFRVFIPTSILGLVTTEAALIFLCYLGAMAWQLTDSFEIYMRYENGFIRVGIVTLTVIVGLYLNDCYTRVKLVSNLVFLQQLCLIIGVAFLLQATLSYGNIDLRMPRQSMLVGSGLYWPVVSSSKVKRRHWLRISSSFAKRQTSESEKLVRNILMKRMDLKSGMLPTFSW